MSVSFIPIDKTKTRVVVIDGTDVLFPCPVEMGTPYDGPGNELNWANTNARAMLGLLGLKGDDAGMEDAGYLMGEATIAECRQALMTARATFQSRAAAFTRETVVEHGPPRERPDGVVELRPVRLHSNGISEHGLMARLEAFELMLSLAVDAGATDITWG